jgi:hypothetical protein
LSIDAALHVGTPIAPIEWVMEIFGMYASPRAAARGVDQLLGRSFDAGAIRVIFFDGSGPETKPLVRRTRLLLGAALGAVIGCILGAGLALSVDIAPTLAVFGGVAAGAFAGAVLGGAFWRFVVDLPKKGGEAGGVLVGVPASSEARREDAREVFEASGATVLAPRSVDALAPRPALVSAPWEHFDSPEALVESDSLSRDEKLRALDSWELDERQKMTAAGENMQGGPKNLLLDVRRSVLRLSRSEP